MVERQQQMGPALEAWLREALGEEGFRLVGEQPLLAMNTLTVRDDIPDIPPEVMAAWRRLIVTDRFFIDQSEARFIDTALAHGLGWQYVADALGFSSAQAAEEHRERLAAELHRLHPSTNSRPWRA
ncbi:hypothetical protein [Nocardia transvalensis]|uniref:hypothetical protein n=1 Tax=Nocardia transvalensis TaxID=37333 RepID=UPI001895E35B|nr:hypothetical protein [Nocardia transvalensis]MBF6330772.1 hypothetical protein [Nocardia transvalensis]